MLSQYLGETHLVPECRGAVVIIVLSWKHYLDNMKSGTWRDKILLYHSTLSLNYFFGDGQFLQS